MRILLLMPLLLTLPARAGQLAGHKFLVTSVRTGDTEIFIVNPQTGDASNVSRSPRSEDRYPCWAPDGRRVAFISDRDGPANLYVMDADGGNVKRLIETPAVCYMPSWAGERIVFGLHGEKPEMASIRDDGTDLKNLGGGHDPCLSPDGKRIAYTGHVAGGVTVCVMRADGSGRRVLVPEGNPFGAVFPSWSPDGRQIIFSKNVGRGLELFVISADGSGLRQVTNFGDGAVCTPAAWSPDGKWISFRKTDEMYWRDEERMKQVYAEKPADKRPVWVVRPDGTDAQVVECLRFQCAIDGSRAAWKPAVVFPTSGALPARFPVSGGTARKTSDDVYVIEEPRRTRDQLRALHALMPGGTFDVPAGRWRNLQETKRRLEEGGTLHIVNLGDSIVNDTARSAWLHLLREQYPKCKVRMTTVVRGGTGCRWYRQEGRIDKLVVPLKPDLVLIGGLSQGGDVDSIREVIRQIRERTPAEILLSTAVFGRMDPHDPATLKVEPCSGYGEYGEKLRTLAEEEKAGLVDLTRYWAEYIRQSGEGVNHYKRDPVHANEIGEQVLGRILAAFFTAEDD